MPGLIHEISELASDPNVKVGPLLRKMKIAAVRLKLDDLESWVDHELEGYPQDGSPVPQYRVQSGTPTGEHRIHGAQPLNIGDRATRVKLSSLPIPQSVGSLENLLAQPYSANSIYWFPYPDDVTAQILTFNQGLLLSCGLKLDESRIVDIIDSVRGRILDWALSMEKAGVTGEGMSFTNAEQATAQSMTVINVNGPNSRANINSTDNSANTVVGGDLFGDLRARIQSEVKDEGECDAILATVDAMEQQKGTEGFVAAYGRFMQAAANHVQIVQPFLEPLGDLIKNL